MKTKTIEFSTKSNCYTYLRGQGFTFSHICHKERVWFHNYETSQMAEIIYVGPKNYKIKIF
jgi:hypothetical protein